MFQKLLVGVDEPAAVDDYGTSIITQNFYLFFSENAFKTDFALLRCSQEK
jgi:hypothetical protein